MKELKRMQENGEIVELPHEKETLRSVIQEKINQHAPVQTSPTPAKDDDDEEKDNTVSTPPAPQAEMPSYLRPELKEQVQHFVNDAFANSIASAAKKARDTNNPALMDAFHDALVDQLFDHLVERGKLERI